MTTHRFLKPKTIQWMKSKSGLNESEAAELIADVEAYRKENDRLSELNEIVTATCGEMSLKIAIQENRLKQAIEALEVIKIQIIKGNNGYALQDIDETLFLIREGESHETETR